jgi:hypothetical protein
MTLPLRQPFAPMEALSVDSIPVGEAWRYEPKRDGFRCLAFRDGAKIRPLDEPLFSGIGSVWQAQAENNGEIVVLADGAFSFDALTSYLMGFAGMISQFSATRSQRLR